MCAFLKVICQQTQVLESQTVHFTVCKVCKSLLVVVPFVWFVCLLVGTQIINCRLAVLLLKFANLPHWHNEDNAFGDKKSIDFFSHKHLLSKQADKGHHSTDVFKPLLICPKLVFRSPGRIHAFRKRRLKNSEFRELFFSFSFLSFSLSERYSVSVPMLCWVEQNDKDRLGLAHMVDCLVVPLMGLSLLNSVHAGLCLEQIKGKVTEWYLVLGEDGLGSVPSSAVLSFWHIFSCASFSSEAVNKKEFSWTSGLVTGLVPPVLSPTAGRPQSSRENV